MMEHGTIFLYIALILNISNVVSKNRWNNILVLGSFAFIFLALIQLICAYIGTDYSVLNVAQNTHELIPLIYRVSGVWGNHEGSMLLWVFLLSSASVISLKQNRDSRIHSAVMILFLLFLILKSNPFAANNFALIEGQGFNPLLQDYTIMIHPPILYAGYAGFSVVFSIALSKLLTRTEPNKDLHAWVCASWSFLSLGIGLGSWWSYRELGWGGFWFWDPVENTSLIIWLSATALLHTIKLQNARWTILLSIATFLLTIMGLTLVRSGILSSIHSFAVDPSRGYFLFGIFFTMIVSSIGIYISRKPKAILGNIKNSTYLLLVLNNIFMITLCITTVVGTLYPILHEAIYHQSISIAEPYYVQIYSVFFIPILCLCFLATLLLTTKHKKLILLCVWMITAGCLVGYIKYALGITKLMHLIYLYLCVLVILASIFGILKRTKISMHLGHLGLVLIVLGATLHNALEVDSAYKIKVGQTVEFNKYIITLSKIDYIRRDNYLLRQAILEVRKNNKYVGFLSPEVRFYPIEQQFTTESGILHTITGDVYSTIGEVVEGKDLELRLQYKPFIYLIWSGVILMVSSIAAKRRSTINRLS